MLFGQMQSYFDWLLDSLMEQGMRSWFRAMMSCRMWMSPLDSLRRRYWMLMDLRSWLDQACWGQVLAAVLCLSDFDRVGAGLCFQGGGCVFG